MHAARKLARKDAKENIPKKNKDATDTVHDSLSQNHTNLVKQT